MSARTDLSGGYQATGIPTGILELWLVFSILYLAAGFLMLIANYRRLDDLRERRR
jgi:hypothetical protein